jgi:hypothetical protein
VALHYNEREAPEHVGATNDKCPTPPDALRYTGVIRLRHSVSRSLVTVGVGVSGQLEKVIWPVPGSAFAWDDSEVLSLCFPLPSYASSHWPPSRPREGLTPRNEWYVRIAETSPAPSSEIMGRIEEVVLYDRLESVVTGGHWLCAGQDILRGATVTIKASPARKPHRPVPSRRHKPRHN